VATLSLSFLKERLLLMGFPLSASNPVLLPPPEGGQPGDARLHWNPLLEPEVDIPCFAALPIACPVLPGDPAFDKLPISRDLDPNTVTLAPMFARWFAGIQYLHQHHHGFSLHTGDTLFTWADVEAEGFSNLPLRTSPTILLKGIGTLDEHHVNMAAIFKAERLAAFFRFSQHGTPALSSQPVPVPGPAGGVSAADLHALIQSLRTPTATLAPLPTATSAERERAKESEGAIIKYQLMFGRTIEVVNPLDIFDKQKTIQLAELTPVFLQVLQASKITAAVQSFQDEVENTAKDLAASDNFLDSMSDVPAGMLDAIFITCLRNFRWAKDPYNMYRESVRDRVGIPHFAAPRQETVQYKERVATGHTIYRQEQAGEDKSRLVRKLSKLYRFVIMYNAASVEGNGIHATQVSNQDTAVLLHYP
jgi:hypothetical protein